MKVIHRVERAQKDLEIQTEAARLSAEFALNAKMIKVGHCPYHILHGISFHFNSFFL